jgi:polar amino acid transport system substrate-binding protein
MFRLENPEVKERTRKMIRGTRMRFGIALVMALATAGIAAGCGDNGGGTGKLGLITDGTLTVGSDIPYPPFEFGTDPSNYKGYDIDIVNEIAKRLDLTPKIVDTPFPPIFTNLAQGRFDMVASSTTITPERQKEVNFSQGYYETDQSLTVKEGSDIQSVDDLPGKTVGAQKATTGASYAEDNTDAASVRTYAEVDDAFNALEAGQVDAVINDFGSSRDAVNAKPGLVIAQRIVTREIYGLAFPKESTELRDAVNGALSDMKDDGTLVQIYKKWFKEAPPATVLKAE